MRYSIPLKAYLAILLAGLASIASAQKVVPLSGLRTEADSGYTSFPFYDDFSAALGIPDTSKWVAGSGAYINLHYGINAPTLGVATLDGLNSSGTPYAFDSPSALGLADELASKHLDLSEITASENLTLSFYWQSRGWGEQPNEDDSLILEFRNSGGDWIRQWGVSSDSITEFKLEEIAVSSAFLYDGFQFRFINYGRLSGPYDTWNIDYIYLNTQNNEGVPNKGIVRDIGFGKQPPQWLKAYSQMPLEAFIQGGETKDTLTTTLRNVRTGGIGDNVTHLFQTTIYANGSLVQETTTPANSINSDGLPSSNGTIFLRENESIEVSALTPFDKTQLAGMDSARIEHRFFLSENSEDLNAVFTKSNDTLLVETKLHDAFAYDDGSAELGWGVNKKFGKFALEFETPVEWEMDAVDIYVARVGRRVTQGGFRIGIWQSIDTADSGLDEILLAPKYYPVSYTDSINAFERFPLETSVTIPAGKFYVVIEQLTDDLLPFGFDVQTDNGDKIYINLSDIKWRQNKEFQGSLMVRPVKRTDIVTALPAEKSLSSFTVYPNPTRGRLFWETPNLQRVELYNSVGRLIQAWTPDLGDKSITFYQQPKGLYLIRAYAKDGGVATRRVILR